MTIVKICGITTLEDAQVAIEAGADLLGFVFYPKSPRYIEVERAREIVKAIRNPQSAIRSSSRFVGLFVNESVERIQTILTEAQLDYAQLHGDESPELLKQLGERAFRAIRPVDYEDGLAQAKQFYRSGTASPSSAQPVEACPRLLVDAYDAKAYGGTGKKADWHAAAEIARHYPNLLLAGGLSVENIAEAIRTVRPWGVDVSSGVEAAPGRKDPQKIQKFIQLAKEVK
ncbi:MAG: phosphoribosylanthranilate isomerase [Caldilineaceae bacterium]